MREHAHVVLPDTGLLLVVPVDEYPTADEGAGPVDHLAAAVRLFVLGADVLGVVGRRPQREQAAAAGLLDLDLLQERDERLGALQAV
ncbi:hypothetical protein [Streptomyces sp. NPDC005077]|uniref:hypothetical protein n=1 Tax=Streptomyces sp. NPDC005077 TaxID=3154292 RepID=UPI0033A5AB11